MSVELQKVKRRIGVTRQIGKVTSAMEKVASARLANDRKAMENSARYTARLTALLDDLSSVVGDVDHPLLKERKAGARLVIVFGSERGLCGGFNSSLVDEVTAFMARPSVQPAGFISVGKVINRRLRRSGLDVIRHFPQPLRRNRAEVLDELTQIVLNRFLTGACAEVHVVYAKFVSGLRQVAGAWRILPAPFLPGAKPGGDATIFEPQARDILYRLLPEFVRQMIDFAFLSSVASENAARQMAMSRATDNAEEMLEDLVGQYRRVRQETITTEMLQLISGRAMG
jgi:F-type H+-transporting ATPase subunit gamma